MSYHVLIVDDDPAICKLLSKVMISNEMDPLVVNSGAAALDLIARQSSTLDMILMDITLGDWFCVFSVTEIPPGMVS